MIDREGDSISTGSIYYHLIDDLQISPLLDDLQFQVSFGDPKFNNDDNEYLEFKLHYYNNIKTGKFVDEIIPIKNCKEKLNSDSEWDGGEIAYCPIFSPEHHLIGGYYDKD